jgi:hypothetical protein
VNPLLTKGQKVLTANGIPVQPSVRITVLISVECTSRRRNVGKSCFRRKAFVKRREISRVRFLQIFGKAERNNRRLPFLLSLLLPNKFFYRNRCTNGKNNFYWRPIRERRLACCVGNDSVEVSSVSASCNREFRQI